MHYSTLLTTALTAAVVIAAPVEKRVYTTEVTVVVETIYTTIYPTSTAAAAPTSPLAALQGGGWGGGWGGHGSHSHHQHTTRTGQAPTSTESPIVVTPTPEPFTSETLAPTTSSTTEVETTTAQQPTTTSAQTTAASPTSMPTAGACEAWQPPTDLGIPPLSCGVDILKTLNLWREAYNKTSLTWSAEMAAAALNTATLNEGGVTQNHNLTQGSNGEVITPGFWEIGDLPTQGDTPFEVALVSWLCEVSSDPQLQASGFTHIDQCAIVDNVAHMELSGAGHHNILLGDYSHVGCAFYPNPKADGSAPQWSGQWACDFLI